MKIIVGLGNIGEKYAKNRHNTGFMVIDELVKKIEKEGIEVNWEENKKLKAIIAKFPYNSETILLVKPTTLMNNSGEAISKILQFYKEPVKNLTVIYDDIDLPLGTIRIRDKGSAGTHNGMKSIIESLGTETFRRIRIGIESRGKLTAKQQELSSFVLSAFTEKEISILKKIIKEAGKKTFSS